MVKPPQPELRRTDLPAANLPGHHPEHEQDKPSGRDFVAKMHALAEQDAWEAPSADDEVLDLTQLEADHVHTGADPGGHSRTGDVLATLAGKPFALVGSVLEAVRDRLPD